MKDNSPFDSEELSVQGEKEIDPVVAEKMRKIEYLTHKVFYQNEDGKELLDFWVDNWIINLPVFSRGEQSNDFDKGIAQGIQQFIRNTLNTCEKVENNER